MRVEKRVALCQQKQELGDSLHGFLQYGLCLVAKYRDIFPPTPSATPKLHTLLRYSLFILLNVTDDMVQMKQYINVLFFLLQNLGPDL